jgi:hypothetical protein
MSTEVKAAVLQVALDAILAADGLSATLRKQLVWTAIRAGSSSDEAVDFWQGADMESAAFRDRGWKRSLQ